MRPNDYNLSILRSIKLEKFRLSTHRFFKRAEKVSTTEKQTKEPVAEVKTDNPTEAVEQVTMPFGGLYTPVTESSLDGIKGTWTGTCRGMLAHSDGSERNLRNVYGREAAKELESLTKHFYMPKECTVDVDGDKMTLSVKLDDNNSIVIEQGGLQLAKAMVSASVKGQTVAPDYQYIVGPTTRKWEDRIGGMTLDQELQGVVHQKDGKILISGQLTVNYGISYTGEDYTNECAWNYIFEVTQ